MSNDADDSNYNGCSLVKPETRTGVIGKEIKRVISLAFS